MASWPPHVFTARGNALGRDSAIITNALEQAQRVQAQGFPAVLTLRHLAEQAGVEYRILREVAARSRDAYRVFHVAKRRGGKRTICVPELPLLRAQRWIARNILANASCHPASVAYAPRCSPLAAARVHVGCSWLVKLDVKSFFESVSERQVFHVFASLGYEPLISFELARLCTRVYPSAKGRYVSRRWRSGVDRKKQVIESYASPFIGHLPQGAPTSPMAANLAMRTFDGRVSEIASALGLVFTRYADDLIFSTSSPVFTRDRVGVLLQRVFLAMRSHGLTPQKTKSVIAPPGARKIVLGLLVDTDRPRLQPRFKRMLEQHVYGVSHFGPAKHAQHRGFKSLLGLRRHLFGLLAYAGEVEPDFASSLGEDLVQVGWPV
jgi:RNA-directed DNA polymerase